METARVLEDIVRFMLPALLVFATVYLLLKRFFDFEQQRRYHEQRTASARTALPIRLQAYERLSLLLERLTINNLILRVKKSGMTAGELHMQLLTEIRGEFDHNLSQQVYISSDLWRTITSAKEDLIKLINLSASSVPPDASALDLSKVIFDNFMQQETPSIFAAQEALKQEARKLF